MALATITITPDLIITIASLLTALVVIFGAVFKCYQWYQKQNRQDEAIASIKKENTLLVYGVLACLDGLSQLNCNGAVTEARTKFSKHLNEEAHK